MRRRYDVNAEAVSSAFQSELASLGGTEFRAVEIRPEGFREVIEIDRSTPLEFFARMVKPSRSPKDQDGNYIYGDDGHYAEVYLNEANGTNTKEPRIYDTFRSNIAGAHALNRVSIRQFVAVVTEQEQLHLED